MKRCVRSSLSTWFAKYMNYKKPNTVDENDIIY